LNSTQDAENFHVILWLNKTINEAVIFWQKENLPEKKTSTSETNIRFQILHAQSDISIQEL